jgi:hypothetical protein
LTGWQRGAYCSREHDGNGNDFASGRSLLALAGLIVAIVYRVGLAADFRRRRSREGCVVVTAVEQDADDDRPRGYRGEDEEGERARQRNDTQAGGVVIARARAVC